MLRKSLSTNRVVQTKAMQCFHATSTGVGIISTTNVFTNQALDRCNHHHHHNQQQQQQYHHFTSSSHSHVYTQQPFVLVSRFKSTSPFPSLKPQSNNQTQSSPSGNGNNGNVKNTRNNNNNNDNNNNTNNNNRNNASGKGSRPWKHFNIPKKNNGTNNTNANANTKNNHNRNNGSNNNNTNNNNNNNKNAGGANRPTNNKPQRQQQQQQQQHPQKQKNLNRNKTNGKNNEIRPIDKLRDSFMQSLQSDRERRQNNNTTTTGSGSGSSFSSPSTMQLRNKDNANTESRLDQLLRMSRQKARTNQFNNQNNNNNYNNQNNNNNNSGGSHSTPTKSGAKLFRERRKMQQQQDEQKHKQYQQRQRERNERYENNKNTNTLQQELLRSNATALNHEMGQNQSSFTTSEDEKIILLPRNDLSLVELSSLLRVPKDKIIKVLHSLGESNAYMLKKTSSNASDDVEERKIDIDMAELIALELGLDPQRASRTSCQLNDAERRILRMNVDENEENENGVVGGVDTMEDFATRPPVVCIMGHVDHGKTTLMDCLRQRALEASGNGGKHQKKAKKKKGKKKKGGANDANGIRKVAGTEAGGITQTVSAFQVALPTSLDENVEDSKAVDKVTFLDTPGHAAFKAMRQSGSNGADVIVLVIAADDGVSPQTVEIIDMYKSIAKSQPGSISLVVAMTKVDKPGIDIEESLMRIENQLMGYDIFSENLSNSSDAEFGGVQVFPVSGLNGQGLDDLIEGLVLQSEIMDLRADTEARAEGLVIDAKMEKGLGVVADCIVRWGKLELGDYVVSGVHSGRVRILNDVNNKSIKKAHTSQPVRIVGLKSLPKAGDPIVCVQSEEMAKEIISRREALNAKESHRAESSDAPLDVVISGGASKKGFMAQNILRKYGLEDKDDTDENDDDKEEEEEGDDVIRIPVILKADADGTLAALRDTLLAIQDESTLNLCIDPISVGIGHITPSDVNMASESGAGIFCFNLKGSKDKAAMSLANTESVEIRSNDVIYHLLDEAKELFSSYCPVTAIDRVHGKATVKAVFDINNNKNAEKVAGLMVEDGIFYLDKSSKDTGSLECHYRVHREGKIITPDGVRAKSLRRVKEEVPRVRRGEECGLNLKDFFDVQEGDIIECFSTEMKRKFV